MDKDERKLQLFVHTKFGNIEKVKQLLEEDKQTVYTTDCKLDTPLHIAAQGTSENHVELVKIFHSEGATVDARNIFGKTALHKVCVSTADLLLDLGAHINNRDYTGVTPLHDACFLGTAKVVEILLVRGATVNVRDFTGNTPAHNAALFVTNIAVLNILIAHGADINMQNAEGHTPLHIASFVGDTHLKLVDLLVENNADTNLKSCRGNTCLHKAVLRSNQYKSNQVCEKLLENGACIDAKNNKGKTPYDLCLGDYSNVEKVIIKIALEKHIVKLKTAGFTVDISLNADSDLPKGFKTECVHELDKMKVTKINNSFSLNIVFLNEKNPWYLKNADTFKKLEEKLNCKQLFKDFPLYGHILRNTFKKTKQKFDLLEAAFSSFDSEKRKQICSVPDLIKFEILYYLSNDDLRNFVESG